LYYSVATDCNSLESFKSILHESALMKEFDHPNVLSVLGVSLNTDNSGRLPFIVLPFMANGDLKTYLKNKRSDHVCADKLPEVCVIMHVCSCILQLINRAWTNMTC